MFLLDLNSIRKSAHGQGNRQCVCTKRPATREKSLRGKHNPSPGLLQPLGRFRGEFCGAGFGL
jgi:hypothetical protein